MAFLGKEYKFERQEKFEEFLKAAGLPEEDIAKLLEFKPTCKLVLNGDTYTFTTATPEGVQETNFKSGVEFNGSFQNKIPISTTITVEGNKTTQKVKSALGDATFVREFNSDELVVTMSSDKFGVVAKRWYKS